MKKLSAFLAALFLLFSLTACGNTSVENNSLNTDLFVVSKLEADIETNTSADMTGSTLPEAEENSETADNAVTADVSTVQPSYSTEEQPQANQQDEQENHPEQPQQSTASTASIHPQTTSSTVQTPSSTTDRQPQQTTSEPTQSISSSVTTLPQSEPELAPMPEPILESEPEPEPDTDTTNVLVAYFSATNTTEGLAEYIADGLKADLYEIMPLIPYTSEDLDYHDDNSRSTIEMNDPDSRPAISNSVDDMAQYDVVFIGYPIWWGEAPRILSTFVESYSFSGKTIVPFCTSGGSGVGSSASNLERLSDGGTWLSSTRLNSSSSRADIIQWINGLGLNITAE